MIELAAHECMFLGDIIILSYACSHFHMFGSSRSRLPVLGLEVARVLLDVQEVALDAVPVGAAREGRALPAVELQQPVLRGQHVVGRYASGALRVASHTRFVLSQS